MVDETTSPMQETPPDLAELYCECGRTTEKVQVMELAAGNFALAYVTFFMDTNNITPELTEWLKHLIEDINSKTFGTLLREIKKSGKIDDSLITIVDEALKSRNYFMHHFFRHHNFAIHSAKGRREMLADIIECQKKFDLARAVFGCMAGCLEGLAGRPMNLELEEAAQRLLAQGKRIKI